MQWICTYSEKDTEVAKALEKVQELRPKLLTKGLEEWNVEQGLILFRGKVYISSDPELHKELVKQHHNAPAAGHPERAKMLELLSGNYWWPSITKFVNKYVDTCDVCQRTKVFPAKPHGFLQPLEIPNALWESVSTDFIVKLSESEGYDSIIVVVDCHTEQIHCVPTKEASDTDSHVQTYIREVFHHHGTLKQMISDRGSVFTSKFLRTIYETIGVKPTMSTAYHPQTDGKTERMNTEIEQYLRVFCSYR